MKAYLDSSIILRIILKQKDPIKGLENYDGAISSALTRTECFRTIDRLRVKKIINPLEISAIYENLDELLSRIEFITINPNILERAGRPCSAPLGTLDAIHLITAIVWSEANLDDQICFCTHDTELGRAAQVYGYKVQGT